MQVYESFALVLMRIIVEKVRSILQYVPLGSSKVACELLKLYNKQKALT